MIALMGSLLAHELPCAAESQDQDGSPEDDGAWVAAMREVHERFTGEPGTFAQFGDSITISMAFWAPLGYQKASGSDETRAALELVKTYMDQRCWREWKGARFGSEGSTTIRWAHKHIDTWLERMNPEVALIMFGSNDLTSVSPADFEKHYRGVIEKCLANGTVVIVSTMPPRNGMVEKSRAYADIVRRLADDFNLPLQDFHAEILRRRPSDWNGATEQFAEVEGTYEVPTLISKDGVHPSNPSQYRSLDGEALNHNGFMLRSYLTLMDYAAVIRHVLQQE